jgi:hypothetical protein
MGYDEKPEILADFIGVLPDTGLRDAASEDEKRARS